MTSPPDPQIACRSCDRFQKPALHQLRRWHHTLPARPVQDPFHCQWHLAPVHTARHHSGFCNRQVGRIVNLCQQSDSPAAALAKRRPQWHAAQPLATRYQQGSRLGGRFPFQRAAANRARLPIGPDQH